MVEQLLHAHKRRADYISNRINQGNLISHLEMCKTPVYIKLVSNQISLLNQACNCILFT